MNSAARMRTRQLARGRIDQPRHEEHHVVCTSPTAARSRPPEMGDAGQVSRVIDQRAAVARAIVAPSHAVLVARWPRPTRLACRRGGTAPVALGRSAPPAPGSHRAVRSTFWPDTPVPGSASGAFATAADRVGSSANFSGLERMARGASPWTSRQARRPWNTSHAHKMLTVEHGASLP